MALLLCYHKSNLEMESSRLVEPVRTRITALDLLHAARQVYAEAETVHTPRRLEARHQTRDPPPALYLDGTSMPSFLPQNSLLTLLQASLRYWFTPLRGAQNPTQMNITCMTGHL